MNKYKPIIKIVVAVVAAGLTWVALQLGMDLGDSEINEAASAIVGILAGYLVPDPRVAPAS